MTRFHLLAAALLILAVQLPGAGLGNTDARAASLTTGGSYYFDGTAYLSGAAPVSGTPFTVGVWGRGESSANTNTLVSIGSASRTNDVFFEAQLETKRTSVLTHASGDYAGPFTAGGGSLDTWHSHTGVFAASDDRRAYRDGGSEARSPGNMAIGTPDTIRIGRWQHDGYPGLNFPLYGNVGYVFVWKVALTPEEIAAWHAGSIPQSDQLMAMYDLTRDWGAGPIPNQTGKGYDLTIQGAVFDGSRPVPATYNYSPPPPPPPPPPEPQRGAYYFDGTDSLTGVAPVSATPFTVGVWARGESSADTNTLVSIGSPSVTNDVFFEAQLEVKKTSVFTHASGDFVGPFTPDGGSLGTWHSHTGVFAASDDRRAYRDGGSEARDSANMAIGTPDTIRVGRWEHGGFPGLHFPLYGHVGYVFVWKVALTPEEIAAWHAGSIPRSDQLMAMYDLTRDWGAGPIPDQTGNGPDLTNNGAVFDGSQPVPATYTYSPPPPPGAYYFNGSAWLERVSGLPVTGHPLTFGVWFMAEQPDRNSAYLAALSQQGPAGRRLALVIDAGMATKRARSIALDDWGNLGSADSSTTLALGAWSSAAAVHAARDDRRVFLNGGGKGTDTAPLNSNWSTFDRAFTVGRKRTDDTSGVNHRGWVGYVFVWKAPLTDAEVAAWHAGSIPQSEQLVAMYDLTRDWGAGPIPDQTGHGYDLTVNGAVFDGSRSLPVSYTYSAPPPPPPPPPPSEEPPASTGGAYSFNGSAYLSGSSPVSTAPFTLGVWARSESAANANALASIGSGTITHSLFFQAQLETKRTGALTHTSGDYAGPFTPSGGSLDTWHSHAGVFAASNDRRVYRDGGSEARTAENMAIGTPDTMLVGRWQHAGYPGLDFPMRGRVGYVFVWSVALTPAEVAAWHAGSIPQAERLVAVYDLTRDWGAGPIPSRIAGGPALTINGATFAADATPPVAYALPN